jgi:hypothetical protein
VSDYPDGFQYRCSQGHTMIHPRPLTRCLAYILGERCSGELKHIGPGSRPRSTISP